MSAVLGIDPSYGGCGIIVLETDTGEILNQLLISTTNKHTEIERVKQIWDKISALFITPIDTVVIEGPSFDSGQKSHQMGYLHYRLREYLYDSEIKPLVIIPSPDQLKKFVTCQGHSKKEMMLKEVYKRWGADFNENDLADAYGLAQLGRAYIGAETKLLKPQTDVITAMKNPKVVVKKSKKKVE